MELLMLFETDAVKDGDIHRIEHHHNGRQITIPAADLSGILDLVPADIITAYQKGATGASRCAFTDAILAARLNRGVSNPFGSKRMALLAFLRKRVIHRWGITIRKTEKPLILRDMAGSLWIRI